MRSLKNAIKCVFGIHKLPGESINPPSTATLQVPASCVTKPEMEETAEQAMKKQSFLAFMIDALWAL